MAKNESRQTRVSGEHKPGFAGLKISRYALPSCDEMNLYQPSDLDYQQHLEPVG